MIYRIAVGAVLAASAALTACNGWPRAVELDQARDHPEKYATYARTGGDHAMEFEHRRWLVSPAPIELTGARLHAVGTAANTVLYAAQGEEAPYGVLYTPARGGKWRRVLPVE